MEKSFYEIFSVLLKTSNDLFKKGIMNTQVEKMRSNITYEYLNGAIKLVKEGITLEQINCYLDYEIQIRIRDNNPDKHIIKEMYIIKHTFKYVHENEIDDLICFSRPYVNEKEYMKLWEMVSELSLIDRESNSSQVKKYDLLKYKGSYVGDISSIGNIIEQLPGNIYNAGLSVQTKKQPYGITVNYKANKVLDMKKYNEFWSNEKVDELLEKNALVLLSLIQNADVVEFNIDNISKKTYKYNRKNLEQKYDKDLKSLFKDDNSFENFLNG